MSYYHGICRSEEIKGESSAIFTLDYKHIMGRVQLLYFQITSAVLLTRHRTNYFQLKPS